MDRFGRQGLTFDDVLLVPEYSEVLPHEVSVATWLTTTIRLHIPLMSGPWTPSRRPSGHRHGP